MLRSLALAALFTLFLPLHVQAHEQRFTLAFHRGNLPGPPAPADRLLLRKELARQFPGMDFSRHRLKKVHLFAESGRGKGRAMLRVGKEVSAPARVPAARASNTRHPLPRITLFNPASHDSDGPWQVLLHGRIKVHRAVLVMDEPRNRWNHSQRRQPSWERDSWHWQRYGRLDSFPGYRNR